MIQKRCVNMLHFVSMGRVGEFPDMFGNFIGILGEKTEGKAESNPFSSFNNYFFMSRANGVGQVFVF